MDGHKEEHPAVVELQRPFELTHDAWVEALFDLVGLGTIEVICITKDTALIKVLKPIQALAGKAA